MKKIILIVAVVAFLGLMAFWQYFLKGYLLLPSVDRFVNSFYEQYNKNDFKYMYDILSHQKIRNKMDSFQFEGKMLETQKQLGAVESKKRILWKRQHTKGVTFFLVEYKVKRAKISSVDKFILIKQKNDWFVYDYVVRAS